MVLGRRWEMVRKILKAVAFFLQRVVGIGNALHQHLIRLDLKGLLGLRRRHQGSLYDNRRAYVYLETSAKFSIVSW